VIDAWEETIARLQSQLAEGATSGDPLEREFHEAQLIWRLDKRIEAVAMLRRGEYMTFEGAEPACPSDCEPITRNPCGWIDGKPVGLAVHVPIASKFLAESSVRYRNAFDAYWRSIASRFNVLSAEERMQKIRHHDSLVEQISVLERQRRSQAISAEIKKLRSELLTQGPLYLDRSAAMLVCQ
jgi:hypothetical protein